VLQFKVRGRIAANSSVPSHTFRSLLFAFAASQRSFAFRDKVFFMNYELAKRLRDAGFPQSGNGRWIGPQDKIVWRSGDRVYVPTLEELIEACGDKFFVLNATKTRGQPNTWYAAITDPNAIEATAATPAEAVAKVWLATAVQ
jgi:hypothetical protein